MTKSRRISLALVVALVFALFASSIIPFAGNTASAVTVVPHNDWNNTYDGDYYDNLNTDKVGLEFRSELASLITTTHTHLTTYSESRDWFGETDADPANPGNIILFYTGTSVKFTGTLGSSSGAINREHVWAKHGGTTYPKDSGPGADAHHLRPTEYDINESRANYAFAEVEQNTNNLRVQAGRTDYGSTPDELCYLGTIGGAKFFYPAKGYRGATARILMYMLVRWGDENNLYFVDGASTADGKGIGKISDLMKWHLEEPPTDEEIRRNDVVATKQGNRNPFIDHPEYAEMILCNDGQSYNDTLKEIVNTYGSYIKNDNSGDNNGDNNGDVTKPGDNTGIPDDNTGNTENTAPTKTPNTTVIIIVSVVAVVLIVAVVVIIVLVKKNKAKNNS
ncbi:MAG: endonuclease [Clostridiales bacterium]|nr:endonuclease [Clostridiales bacterium]